MIRIYFNNRPLILTTTISPELEKMKEKKKTIIANGTDPETISGVIQQLQQEDVAAGIITAPSVETLFNVVNQQFTLIRAAGGFVYTPDHQILFIFRRGKWDLPKGKLDEGEDLPSCALREVKEETGVTGLQLQQPLIITYHTYYEKNTPILKESHWYLMLAAHPTAFTPQIEEDISACRWVPINDTASVLNNTHPSIRDVVQAGTEYIRNQKPSK